MSMTLRLKPITWLILAAIALVGYGTYLGGRQVFAFFSRIDPASEPPIPIVQTYSGIRMDAKGESYAIYDAAFQPIVKSKFPGYQLDGQSVSNTYSFDSLHKKVLSIGITLKSDSDHYDKISDPKWRARLIRLLEYSCKAIPENYQTHIIVTGQIETSSYGVEVNCFEIGTLWSTLPDDPAWRLF